MVPSLRISKLAAKPDVYSSELYRLGTIISSTIQWAKTNYKTQFIGPMKALVFNYVLLRLSENQSPHLHVTFLI